MILLDTNVISAIMRPLPDAMVIQWLDRQPRASVWTTSVTVLEVRFGLRILPAGKRRNQLAATFELVLQQKIDGRVAPLDNAAALLAADLMALRQSAGRPGDIRDAMIAGIALATRASIATRNTRHFDDLTVPVIDPWLNRIN